MVLETLRIPVGRILWSLADVYTHTTTSIGGLVWRDRARLFYFPSIGRGKGKYRILPHIKDRNSCHHPMGVNTLKSNWSTDLNHSILREILTNIIQDLLRAAFRHQNKRTRIRLPSRVQDVFGNLNTITHARRLLARPFPRIRRL